MRIIVCGSRDWTDRQALNDALDDVLSEFRRGYDVALTIVHGACRGPDLMAADWALKTGVSGVAGEPHPADWDTHGKSAGFRRNAEMATLGADLCIAARDGTSRGTLDMITRATKAGIPVRIVPRGKR